MIFACAKCGQDLAVETIFRGQQAECPTCGRELRVPSVLADAPAPSAAPPPPPPTAETPAMRDQTPLQGLPRVFLDLSDTRSSDLTPLTGMRLPELHVTPAQITQGMEVVRAMPSLVMINALPAAAFWQQWDAAQS